MLTGRADRGTVLLMFPAAMLIMVVLGAIVIDVGLSQVRARELDAVAASAANDTLGALDIHQLRTDGTVRLDQHRAVAIAEAAVAAGPLPDAVVTEVAITTDSLGRPEVAVTLQLEVRLIIAPALPGDLEITTIRRTAAVTILG